MTGERKLLKGEISEDGNGNILTDTEDFWRLNKNSDREQFVKERRVKREFLL